MEYYVKLLFFLGLLRMSGIMFPTLYTYVSKTKYFSFAACYRFIIILNFCILKLYGLCIVAQWCITLCGLKPQTLLCCVTCGTFTLNYHEPGSNVNLCCSKHTCKWASYWVHVATCSRFLENIICMVLGGGLQIVSKQVTSLKGILIVNEINVHTQRKFDMHVPIHGLYFPST